MHNLKTVAAASALLGGVAIFVLDTSRSPQVARVQVSDAPARFPSVNAMPISKRHLTESSTADETELIAYTLAPRLLAASTALQLPAPNPGTAAEKPKIIGIHADDPATSANLIDNANPRTNKSKVFVKVEFPGIDGQVPKGALTIRIGKNGSDREARIPIKDRSKKTQLLPFDVAVLEMKQAEDVVALWDPDEEGPGQQISLPSDPLKLWVDNVPPRILSVQTVGETGGVAVLEIQFANNDLKKESLTVAPPPDGNFLIHRTGGQHEFATAHTSFSILDRPDDNFVVRLNLGSLITDLYQIEVKARVTDQHGNALAEPRKFTFNSLPQTANGPHVPFPEFVHRKERQPQDLFNPGDKVETRVARLYYIRDAHRVAQIINRNVKSFNQSGVDRAKLTAKAARESAEQAARDRQTKERDAIRAAEAGRQLEQELAGARQELEQMRAVMSQRALNTNQGQQKEKDVTVAANERIVADKTAEVDALQKSLKALVSQIAPQQQISEDMELEIQDLQYKIDHPTTGMTDAAKNEVAQAMKVAQDKKAIADAKLVTLKARKDALTTQVTTARTALQAAQTALAQAEQLNPLNLTANPTEPLLAAVRTKASKVAELERAVADKRQIENDKREKTEQAQELEDRARENQFRAEVAASIEDPDTYVPGDVKSEDPVTQVSVSVIGEGLLQLRGPIRGINKIRTMINQIDAPLGQVKVGIFTVQVNGEHGNRMEKVATRIEGHIDLSRFLTNQSLGYLRRAIQEVAGAVVANVDAQFPDQHRQIDRDRKYLYAFFGRAFIDELYEMDSEFLRTENKLLSLHGMDTVSQSQACFIMALSKNDIRQQILDRFRCLIECDLPQAEWDYRKTSSLLPCKLNSQKEVCRNAFEKYKFRNVHGFFEASVYGSDTMTPMQREFIRLAQIFKSQLVAEVELKQRVIERGLIEDASNSDQEKARMLDGVHSKALQQVQREFENFVENSGRDVTELVGKLQLDLNIEKKNAKHSTKQAEKLLAKLRASCRVLPELLNDASIDKEQRTLRFGSASPKESDVAELLSQMELFVKEAEGSKLLRPKTVRAIQRSWNHLLFYADQKNQQGILNVVEAAVGGPWKGSDGDRADPIIPMIEEDLELADAILSNLYDFGETLSDPRKGRAQKDAAWEVLKVKLDDYLEPVPFHQDIYKGAGGAIRKLRRSDIRIQQAEAVANRVRRDIDHRKLLEFLIDEQDEKYIELVEGTRSHIAQIDNYLKRLAIALEDDFKVQFYDPAFVGIRAASREWDVNLGQVERTTILTNNRQFAKVSPQATMEFDLPKRATMIVEGMNDARALVQEYGTLLQDPTFLSLAGMMSGAPVSAVTGGAGALVPGLPNQGLRTASVRSVLPGQSTDTAEQLMAQTSGPDRKFGAALEGLIPDPAVYKFETGTGFEIRPVIQPDGHSVIYDFDYMYTTNVREPVRPDEKHLGRVKRHLIHTQVQTSSFELREISRYQVALKASRTCRGVPLLEDIPGAGVLFQPLPSDESSLQQNIILGQSTVYPTLFDLMGLRWSKYVADLDHIALRDLEHVVRGREQAIHDFTFDEASNRVDEFLDIRNKQPDHVRKDFYHQQRRQSPYHPGGFHHRPDKGEEDITDPHNRNFTIPDRRPEENRAPAYDALRRNPIDSELRQIPTPGGQPADIDLRLMPPEDVPLQESSSRSDRGESAPPASKKTSQFFQKSNSSTATIQPASYEQQPQAPKVIDDVAGRAHPAAPAIEARPPTAPKKKSWVGNLKPLFTK